ncbi:MAG TPA: hypothetical protein VH186_11620 [Chloroflexia bacterium]|nr:hypothetical protein [Chloroflexia bacterium]
MSDYGNNGNGFSFNGNGNGHDHENEPIGRGNFEEDEDHEHTYVSIAETHNVSAYEEQVHQVITLEFHDRGLTLDFSLDEAEELGHVLSEVMNYISRKRTV